MLDLDSRPDNLVQNFEQVKELLRASGPESLHATRENALERFKATGIPATGEEEFKYISLKVLRDGGFKPAYGATIDRNEMEQTTLGKIDAITVTFVNGEYAPELSNAHVLPKNVFVGSLEDGFQGHTEQILQHLGKVATHTGKLGTGNDERFVDLNTAFIGEGAFIYIPKNVALESPIHLQFLSKADHGPLVSHPRILIILEEAAQAKLIESYIGMDGVYFTNSVTEVVVGKNAILEHTKFQQEAQESVHIATIAAHQEANSVYTSNNINFGGKIVRNDINIWLNDEHTETWLNGANVGLEQQVIDNHTRIDHAKPNCNSFEVYKSILGDHATGVFNGKIFVYEDAQKTDAKQTNQAILLSKTATFNTKPQLEIFADDVKCTHGATIGQLREDALFYLRARGIPQAEAQAMLVYAFAAEVLDKVTVHEAREAFERVLFERLNDTNIS